MILDSEDQRETLLNALNAVELRGPYQPMAELIEKISNTIKAINEATIAEKPGPKEVLGSKNAGSVQPLKV